MLISPDPDDAGILSSRILLAEPDPEVRAALAEYLRHHGYAITAPAEENLHWPEIRNARFDVLVVNPELIRQGAGPAPRRPVAFGIAAIALGGSDEALSRLSRLGCRFHARLCYPVQPRKLMVAIRRAVVEARIASGRPERERVRAFRFAGWTLGADSCRMVSHEGRAIGLGRIECRLLKALLAYPNQALSREQLIGVAFRSGRGVTAKSVETAIHRLRLRLGDDTRFPGILKTIRGVGYMLDVLVEKEPLP